MLDSWHEVLVWICCVWLSVNMVNISKHALRPDFSTLVLFQKSRDLFRCNYLLYSTSTYSTRLNFTQFVGVSIRWQYLISGTLLVSAWPGFQVSWPNPKLWRQQSANHRLDSRWVVRASSSQRSKLLFLKLAARKSAPWFPSVTKSNALTSSIVVSHANDITRLTFTFHDMPCTSSVVTHTEK